MGNIEAPPKTWKTPLELASAAYEHEKIVTGLINNIASIADKENDYASKGILQWFVDEQIEEESSTDEIAQKLKLIKSDGPALLLLDKELSTRVFVYPTTLNANQGGQK